MDKWKNWTYRKLDNLKIRQKWKLDKLYKLKITFCSLIMTKIDMVWSNIGTSFGPCSSSSSSLFLIMISILLNLKSPCEVMVIFQRELNWKSRRRAEGGAKYCIESRKRRSAKLHSIGQKQLFFQPFHNFTVQIFSFKLESNQSIIEVIFV